MVKGYISKNNIFKFYEQNKHNYMVIIENVQYTVLLHVRLKKKLISKFFLSFPFRIIYDKTITLL